MKKIVELVILGEPVGKERPRYSQYNGFVRTYTPQKTINYESLIVHEYNQKYGKLMFDRDEPIKATINAYFGLTKSDFGKKGLNKSGREKISQSFATIHIDLDNVLKSVFDALNSICYYDDKQIAQVLGTKYYTIDTPRVEIRLESLKGEEKTLWKTRKKEII